MALVVGVVVSMLFYERVQLTTGGAIVPAYLALHLPQPLLLSSALGALDPLLLGLAGIGFMVPGILAHDVARQHPGRTVLAVMATTGILAPFVFVFESLVRIAPGVQGRLCRDCLR